MQREDPLSSAEWGSAFARTGVVVSLAVMRSLSCFKWSATNEQRVAPICAMSFLPCIKANTFCRGAETLELSTVG